MREPLVPARPMENDASNPFVVCHVLRHYHPVLAGAAERFRRYAPGLRARGIGMTVITSHSDPALPVHEVMDDGVEVHRVNAICKETGLFDDRLLFHAAKERLLSGAIRADIVQTIEASPQIAPVLWRLRMRGFRLVHVGTMVGMEDQGEGVSATLKARLRHAVSVSPFHKLVVSTRRMARWSAAMGAGMRRQTVISNGVDTTRFCPVRDESEKRDLRAALGLPKEGLMVLFVGNLLARKGPHLVLESWPALAREFPGAFWVAVGPSVRPTLIKPEAQAALAAYQANLKVLAAKAPEGTVHFTGERSDVELFYRAADVFVLPSEQEGMGNVVLEAFASALPCVVTDYVGLPTEEFGEPGREFVCVPRDSGSIATALRRLLASAEERGAMARRAHAWACGQLDVQITLDRYAALYRGVTGRASAPS